MGFEISYREHRIYANPATIVWSKPTGTIFRGNSTPNLSQGRWYMFFVVDRAWLDGKYIRWRWQGSYSWTFSTYAQIWDGEYDRSSMVDFPDQAGPISKGNGILQTLDQNSGTFAMETKDVQADTSGGSEEKCTVIFYSSDGWSGQTGWYQLDWIEINSGAGGVSPISNEQFTDNIIPEQAGTTADYGYIGYGQADPITLDLLAGFVSGQGSQDLPASFTAAQWQADLPCEVIIRRTNTENLPGSFSIRRTATSDILGEFIARHADAENLLGIFDIGQSSAELSGAFTIRSEGSEDLLGIFSSRQADSTNLLGVFDSRQADSADLLGIFTPRRVGSENLLGEFVVRQWRANLLGIFSVRQAGSAELPGAAIIRHAASTDLRMSFWVQFYSVDLPASLYIRPAGSRATDFQVKDRTRGLTVHDPDRVMTITPRRKMRVR